MNEKVNSPVHIFRFGIDSDRQIAIAAITIRGEDDLIAEN